MNFREELKKTLNTQVTEKEEEVEFIIVSIKEKWFAIELGKIVEVSEIKNKINFPIAPSYIKGLQFIHGNTVILFDILEILGGKTPFSQDEINNKLIVVVKYEEDHFGIIVSDLVDTYSIRKQMIADITETKEFYKGTFEFKNKIVSILDIEKIIESTYEKEE